MPTPILRLLVVRSSDIERLSMFYQLFGFKFELEQHGSGPEHYAAPWGDGVFEIYPLAAGKVDSSIRLGFEIDNLQATIETVPAAGGAVIKEPRQTRWGFQAIVTDPEGRTVELYNHD